MVIRFTKEEMDLLQRSLEHSIESGQFFFTMYETEKLREILNKKVKKRIKNDERLAR